MERYSLYKDSGIKWVGEVPQHWRNMKVKWCFKVKNGREIIEAHDNNKDLQIDVYGSGGVFKKTDKFLYDKESVLFGRKGTIGKPIHVLEKFWTVDTMYYTEFKRDMFPRFFYYMLNIFPWDLITTKTALPSVVGSEVENSECVVPEIEEQMIISNFLDEKTSEIDLLIGDKEKLVELLEERRQIKIVELITKGLNPDVIKKDSNIEWIGKIPEHWEEKKIKYLFYEVNERNFEEEVELLSLFTSIGVRPRSEMEDRGNKAQTVMNYKKVKKGDIVVNKLLAWMGAIGISNYEGVTSPDYDVYRPINENVISNKFYHYYFRSHYFKGDCFKFGRGIMMMRWRTYPEQFKSIPVPVPPINEQIEIANYIDKKTKEIDLLITETKNSISKLKEYRQSLIYEAVTGKIDVREYKKVMS